MVNRNNWEFPQKDETLVGFAGANIYREPYLALDLIRQLLTLTRLLEIVRHKTNGQNNETEGTTTPPRDNHTNYPRCDTRFYSTLWLDRPVDNYRTRAVININWKKSAIEIEKAEMTIHFLKCVSFQRQSDASLYDFFLSPFFSSLFFHLSFTSLCIAKNTCHHLKRNQKMVKSFAKKSLKLGHRCLLFFTHFFYE